MLRNSEDAGDAWVNWARSDVGAAARAACITGTATLPQYAGVLKPMVDAVHMVCLLQMLAAEARERAGLRSRRDNWVMLTLHRLAVYPPGYQLPADVTRTVEDAVDMALTAPPPEGLIPESVLDFAETAHCSCCCLVMRPASVCGDEFGRTKRTLGTCRAT